MLDDRSSSAYWRMTPWAEGCAFDRVPDGFNANMTAAGTSIAICRMNGHVLYVRAMLKDGNGLPYKVPDS